ncbi:YihY/virulence factor BrkB family protein [Wolbachia endosymbiont of Brugia malayi]|uniref:YihY/virulence factor BrkB family protein n=1 Tax=unclassified Wolbachia TaxID=2640676 RepID=UPI00004C93E8|nr:MULTISPECIES: YihY/virulence factor BrkB family protein [unclassified Wolbachia]AAW71064.1 tRNA processing exoribonuclease BN [Wolbachia endosymbiont strain TRS of Brugia malayi]QCB62009.1 YihY/virulence factor BrkB family protein [Wolbachia endosymbiont of Brugia malayi]QIT36317.1 yihY family inner membrane domain protein [Wolbachia endosymbiont of Brugia pahangi]
MNKLLKKFYGIIYCLYHALIDTIYNDGMEHAGYLSFLILLSIFPFLIVLMALASTFANFLDQYNIGWTFIIDNMPQDILASLMPRIREIISGPPQSLLTLAIVGAIWTASSTIEGLRTILNKAYKVPVSPPYVLRRILSILQFLIITFIITLTIVFSTLVPMLIDFSYHGLSYTRYLLIEFVLFIVVSWLYFMLPNIRQNVSDVFPGSYIAVMLWTVSASAFKQYLRASFDQLDLIYGSLGGVVVSLLFFYMVSLIFIYGAKFNFQLKCFNGSR